MTDITSRRTIEALRAGVPNSDAVRQLGCHHREIEGRFRDLLEATTRSGVRTAQPEGLIVGGDFGSGKSHLLEYLSHLALEQGFICSKVVISKETSLADPVKVSRAIAAEVKTPGRLGAGLQNVAAGLAFNSPAYTAFYEAVGTPEYVPDQFAASLYLYEYGRDPEMGKQIERFWSGDPLSNTVLRRALTELGQAATYALGRQPVQRDLAIQRIRFLAGLTRAAGHRGLVLLIDEVELIGQYGLKQRARAYQELARWLGMLAGETGISGLATVAAITNDFETHVLTSGKCDFEEIPVKLGASAREADHELARNAERGMRIILEQRLALERLTPQVVSAAHADLRRIYGQAFDWEAPPVYDGSRPLLSTDVMRPLVRSWIARWDLERRYPSYTADIAADQLPAGYEEEPELTDGDA